VLCKHVQHRRLNVCFQIVFTLSLSLFCRVKFSLIDICRQRVWLFCAAVGSVVYRFAAWTVTSLPAAGCGRVVVRFMPRARLPSFRCGRLLVPRGGPEGRGALAPPLGGTALASRRRRGTPPLPRGRVSSRGRTSLSAMWSSSRSDPAPAAPSVVQTRPSDGWWLPGHTLARQTSSFQERSRKPLKPVKMALACAWWTCRTNAASGRRWSVPG